MRASNLNGCVTLCSAPPGPYLCCIEGQCLLQKCLCVGCQAVVYQQVSCIVKRQVAIWRRGRAQCLAQTLQSTAAVACGPPEQSSLIVDQPAWYSSLQTHTFVLLKIKYNYRHDQILFKTLEKISSRRLLNKLLRFIFATYFQAKI